MLCQLARAAGFTRLPSGWRTPTRSLRAKTAHALGRWARTVPPAEVKQLESKAACIRYMGAAGYRLSSAGNATDYAAVRAPRAWASALAWAGAVRVEGCPAEVPYE